jgi:hypothetical protein
MDMRRFVAITLFAVTASVHAGEIYLIGGHAFGAINDCDVVSWRTDAIFYNNGSDTARVSFRGVSNGPERPHGSSFEIPPGRSASLVRMVENAWEPLSNDPLWVLHVETTGDVLTKNLLLIGTGQHYRCHGIPPIYYEDRGRVALPPYTSLTPANARQVHLGTYLGRDTPSRLNVGVYNAASVSAEARIEVRRHCDDSVVVARTATIPANNLTQIAVTKLGNSDAGCAPYLGGDGELGGPPASLYTVVVVDQPSVTYVANVIDSVMPIAGVAISPP